METSCADCGAVFGFNDAFYAERGLRPPRRCKPCRDARRPSATPPGVRVRGVVAFVHPERDFGFLEAAGRRFYFTPCDAPGVAVHVGAAVTFEAADEARGPRARVIRPADSEVA